MRFYEARLTAYEVQQTLHEAHFVLARYARQYQNI